MNTLQSPIKTDAIILRGGLDLVTPALQTPPGRCISALNYEPAHNGYARFQGFERADGHPAPSAASYWFLNFDAGQNDVTADDVVIGATSNAYGKALDVATVESGTFGGNDADGYFVLEGVSGTFQNNETLQTIKAAFTSGGGATPILIGNTVTGSVSTETAVVVGLKVTSGNWNDGDAAGTIYVRSPSGAFQAENLTVGGVDLATIGGDFTTTTHATADGVATERGAEDDATDTTHLQDAIETRRGVIGTVPGSGLILGVWYFNGEIMAFRNNSGGTAAQLYKSSTSGWVLQNLGRYIAFTSGGTTAIAVGDTIEGDVSGAQATITKVVLTSGTWAGGDAAGILYFASQTGTFQAENLDVGASTNLATIAGDSTAITLSPSGRYEFENYNFYATTATQRVYGADGVNKAFEYDGSVFAPITTGIGTDTPKHVACHKNHLCLSFDGGILGLSQTGEPQLWDGALGAVELGMGQDITGLVPEYADTMVVFARNRISVLYGSDIDSYQLVPFTRDAGAIEWSIQMMGYPVYMDDAGIRSLPTAQVYGDFRLGILSDLIHPLLERKKRSGITVVATQRVRTKDIYRVFFSDGSGLSMFLGTKNPEVLPIDLGMTIRCACTAEDSSGNEILYFGSDDGYVYQIDSGTSFDGEEMEYYLRLAFNNSGSPERNKRYKKVTADVDADPETTILLTASFSYGDPDKIAVAEQSLAITSGGGFWDEVNWDQFYWDNPVRGQAIAYIDGIGSNISVTLGGASTYEEPHVIHGIIYEYSFRGLVK